MAIRFTVNKFPLDPESRDATGLPWGCVVQPFALDDEAGIPGSGVAASVGTGGSSIRKSSSNSSFPRFGSSSSLNSASGGTALQPLPAALSPAPLPLADDVARCEDCYAYINPYCAIDRFSWRCSLCDVVNPFSDAELRRYGGSNVADVAELSHTLVELDVAAEGDADEVEFEQGESQGDGEVAGSIPHGLGEPISSCHVLDEAEIRKRPVYIAMVDVSGSEEFLELVKSSLLAALEALSPAALFGLVTFGSKVGLYDLQGPVAAVKSVAIPASSAHRLPLALGDLLPLPAFLASLSRHKEHAAAALETLRPDPPPLDLDASGGGKGGGGKGGAAQGAGGKGGGGKGGKDAERGGRKDGVRGFGTALDALIRYLGGMEDGPSARIARGLRADVINTSGSGGGGGGNVSIAAAAAAAAAAGEVGPFVGARLLVFLSGAPNHGMGALSTVRYDTALASLAVAASQRSRSAKDVADPVVADKGLLQEQTPFYRELAAAAVQAGVCVDLFAVPTSLRCLSVESGGTLFLYPSLDEATLPQDIYRMLCRPSAFGGVLRLRTSRELRAVRAYGHFFPDAQYENLYHIIRCDPFDSYAFDLEFRGKAGFGVKGRAGREKGGSGGGNRGAVLQLAFQYTVIIPVEGGGERGEGVGGGNGAASNGDGAATGHPGIPGRGIKGGQTPFRPSPCPCPSLFFSLPTAPQVIRASLEEGLREGRLLLQDWLVIRASLEEGVREGRLLLQDWLVILTAHHNHAFGLAQFNQPFPSPPSSFPQVIRASLEEGVREGRLLLQDWLVILTAHYNHAFGLAQFNQPHSVTRLDVSFSACPQLQPLPRLAFALLRSPLLQLPREGVHPDLRTFLHCLYGSLRCCSCQGKGFTLTCALSCTAYTGETVRALHPSPPLSTSLQFNQPHSVTRLDVSFSACPQLQPLPRLAFALLRSPLLQLPREGVHPDLRTFLHCLYRCYEKGCILTGARSCTASTGKISAHLHHTPPLNISLGLYSSLLCSPLLQLPRERVHPDLRTFLHCLYSCLQNSSAVAAKSNQSYPSVVIPAPPHRIYPVLSSFTTPDRPFSTTLYLILVHLYRSSPLCFPPHRSSLDPSFLMRAVYPVLSSYTTPDRPAFPRHSLSRAALVTSGSPIFLLDAFSTIIIFYSPAAPPDLPFPPPQTTPLVTSGSPIFLLSAFSTIIAFYSPAAPADETCPSHRRKRYVAPAAPSSYSPAAPSSYSPAAPSSYSPAAPADLPFPPPQTGLLRTTINRLKADRIITPRTITIRGGVDSTAPFETFLIEEQDVDGDVEGGAVGMGFVAFLESIARDVREYMK
ncbi:unnamed protein product [Closterium sp. NIES-65]|nr:unnamed protein product [Closterium sp. NIES-65]